MRGNAVPRRRRTRFNNSHICVRPTSRNAKMGTNNTVHTILRYTNIRSVLTGSGNSSGPRGLIGTAFATLSRLHSTCAMTRGHNIGLSGIFGKWVSLLFVVTAVGVRRIVDEVGYPGSRGHALSTLNLGGVGTIMRRRTAPSVLNVIGGMGRLIGMVSWRSGVWVVGLDGVGPTTNSAGSEGHVKHNPNSKGNNASAHNRGNTGSHSKCSRGVNFRKNRVPVRHHLPGFNFGDLGPMRCGTVGLSALRRVTATHGVRSVSISALVRLKLVGGGMLIGVLNGNAIADGLRIGTRTFSGTTRRTVMTTNNDIIGLWLR